MAAPKAPRPICSMISYWSIRDSIPFRSPRFGLMNYHFQQKPNSKSKSVSRVEEVHSSTTHSIGENWSGLKKGKWEVEIEEAKPLKWKKARVRVMGNQKAISKKEKEIIRRLNILGSCFPRQTQMRFLYDKSFFPSIHLPSQPKVVIFSLPQKKKFFNKNTHSLLLLFLLVIISSEPRFFFFFLPPFFSLKCYFRV